MSVMSSFCKAYPLERLARFTNWKESPVGEADSAGNYLFVHDNYVVTRGIFLDESVVLSDVTPEWIAFCQDELNFAIPPDVVKMNANPASDQP